MLETKLNSTLTLRVRSNTAVKKKKGNSKSMGALLKLKNQTKEGKKQTTGIIHVETTSRESR